MKTISMWQPWASLYLTRRKLHETRPRPLKYRGWLGIHAAQRFEKDHPPALAAILRDEFGADWFKTLPTGAVIGAVKIIDCIPTDVVVKAHHSPDDIICGNFAAGRFAWQRDPKVHLFEKPIPYRGMQGFFEVPDELLPILPVRGFAE